jgi:hypothetical protein
MAVRGTHGGDGAVSLPEVLPADVPCLSRTSWELGARIVEDDESRHVAAFERGSGNWRASFFEVTSNTVLIRIRTPVGRERFYGTVRSALDSALPELEAAASWRRIA